jgi:hypothetical protein
LKRLILLLAIAATACAPASSRAGASFTETFDTQTYLGELGIGGAWDTASGSLHIAPRQMSLLGSVGLGDWSGAVVIRGDYAFAGTSAGGMQIVDISDPAAPVAIVTHGAIDGTAIDVRGDLAVIAGSDGVALVDITTIGAPVTLWTQSGDTGDAVLDGNRLYLARTDSLQIFDISNPATPLRLGAVAVSGNGYGMDVHGRHAFMARGDHLAIVDVGDPASPVIVGSESANTSYVDVVVEGDLAFATIVDTGVRAYDVSDPSNPVVLDTFSPGGYVWGVEISGDALFVAWRDDGVIHLDVSNPSDLKLVSTLDTPGYAEGVAVSGGLTVVADGLYLRTIQNASTAFTGWSQYATQGAAVDVEVQGQYIYLLDSGTGLNILEIQPGAAPVLLDQVPFASPTDLAVNGDYAYVANGTVGFSVVDVSDPTNASIVHSYSAGLFSSCTKMVAEGHLVYFRLSSFGTGTVYIMDTTDPTAPVWLGSFSSNGGLDVDGGLAVTGEAFITGLTIVDVSDPNAPSTLATVFGPLATEVRIEGDVAYVAGGSTFRAFSIADPANPVEIGTVAHSGTARDLTVEGDYAWLSTDSHEFLSVLVTDPTSMALNTSWLGKGRGLFRHGENLFTAADSSGLKIWKAMNRRFAAIDSYARSTNVNPNADPVVAARVTSTNAPYVGHLLSGDGGGMYSNVNAGVWHPFSAPGVDCRWMAIVGAYTPGSFPAIDDLTVDFLYEFGQINAVADVGNDQGRNVRLTWDRSGYDYVGSPQPIVEYDLYRRQVPGLAPAAAARPDGALAAQLAGWDYVATIPARTDDVYSAIVPTLADSTLASGIVYSTFMVRAITTTIGVHYDSYADSGYSVDNLAPMAPANALANYGTGSGNQLSWDPPVDEDFQHFRIYRDTDPDFTPAPGNQVAATTANAWTDPGFDTEGVFYKLSAVDFSGNESGFAAPDGPTVGIDGEGRPQVLILYPGAPNPFRGETVLRFGLPAEAQVELLIYDITGRRVKTLARGRFEGGRHSVRWNGRDDGGRALAPGLYLARLIADGDHKTRRLVRVE